MQPHCAPFSQPILDRISVLMADEKGARVVDPYAGTMKVLTALPPGTKATMIDIEECFLREGITRYVKSWDNVWDVWKTKEGVSFEAIPADSSEWLGKTRKTFTHAITSPDYGNRFTDKFNPTPGRRCRSYAQSKGGPLEWGNAAQFKFGSQDYMCIHYLVMESVVLRLVDGGKLILNVSDFYRTLKKGEPPTRMPVVAWWTQLCFELGLQLHSAEPVYTRRFKHGENRHRVPYETLLVFTKT